MRLLLPDELPQVPLERVVRHPRLGGFVMLAFVAAPAVAAACCWRGILESLAALPWFFWIPGGPVLAGSLLLWLLVFSATRSVAQAGLLPTNWLLRVSSAGVGVHLRSFRNAHFRRDVPTVLWLERGEIARARKVVESGWMRGRNGKTRVRTAWLELELANVDCAAIERRLDEERREQGPEVRRLGIRMRTRFGGTSVFFARPGVLRVEWLGKRMLEALREEVEISPVLELDLDAALGTELEPRVRALCARGMRMAAHELVRRERRVSWTDARTFVEETEKRAA